MIQKRFIYMLLVSSIVTMASLVYLKSTEHIYTMGNSNLNSSGELNSSHNNLAPNQSSKIKVGVLIPTTSRGVKKIDIKSFSLLDISIKSISETIEPKYDYTIYVGVDVNDSLVLYQDDIERSTGSLKVVMVLVRGRTFTKAVNVIAEKAIKNGMDYLVRVNDDMKIVTYKWTSLSIESLLNNDPPNVGVVGPTCKQGNTAIMTSDFVHATHHHIFGFYYPPPLENWWADDWITRVYMPLRSTRLSTWEVIHKQTYGKRYSVDWKQKNALEKLIKLGNQSISSYVDKLRHE